MIFKHFASKNQLPGLSVSRAFVENGLNTSKNELITLKSIETKKATKHSNFRKSDQNIQPTSHINYLGVLLQEDLQWTTLLVNLKKKLSHSNGLLSKVRYYVPKHLLREIYYRLFNFHLIYACEFLGQNQTNQIFMRLLLLQEKAVRLMNFQSHTWPSNNYLKKITFLRLQFY